MIDIYIRIEVVPTFQKIESKLGVDKLHGADLTVKFHYMGYRMNWVGQVGLALAKPFNPAFIESEVLQFITACLTEEEPGELRLGNDYDGGALKELDNEVKEIVRKGSKRYILTAIPGKEL